MVVGLGQELIVDVLLLIWILQLLMNPFIMNINSWICHQHLSTPLNTSQPSAQYIPSIVGEPFLTIITLSIGQPHRWNYGPACCSNAREDCQCLSQGGNIGAATCGDLQLRCWLICGPSVSISNVITMLFPRLRQITISKGDN